MRCDYGTSYVCIWHINLNIWAGLGWHGTNDTTRPHPTQPIHNSQQQNQDTHHMTFYYSRAGCIYNSSPLFSPLLFISVLYFGIFGIRNFGIFITAMENKSLNSIHIHICRYILSIATRKIVERRMRNEIKHKNNNRGTIEEQ